MEWRIAAILNLSEERQWKGGCCAFGFHGADGKQYMPQRNQVTIG